MADKWVTMAEACQILGVSQRTLHRRITRGEIPSKKEGKRRLVLIDDSQIIDISSQLAETVLMEQLHKENELLRQQLERYEERSQRQDTIILQLTRQLEQSQRLLEYHKEPFWRRWISKKKEV